MKNKNDFVFKSNSIYQAGLLSGAHIVSDVMTESGHPSPLADAEVTKADEKAGKKLFEVANTYGLDALQEHIEKNTPNALTIAFLLIAAQGQAKSELSSKNASKRARSSRKEECKNMALEIWKDWQNNPDRYRDKTEFCHYAVHKISSKKKQVEIDPKTMNVWFDHFRLAETSTEWEAKFGNKYTTEKSEKRAPGKTPIAMLLDF